MLTVKSKPRKTVEDFMRLPEGTRAELIDGEIFMSPSPRLRHQWISRNIFRPMADHVERNGLGYVIYAPMDVHLPSSDIVQPDVIFVAAANRGILQDWIRGVPDLAIEILYAEGIDRDRIVKKDLYASNGVREYWIIDDDNRSAEIFVLQGRAYQREGYFRKDESVTSTVLPGLSLAVREIFAA